MQRLRTGSGDAAKITSRLWGDRDIGYQENGYAHKIPKGTSRLAVTDNSRGTVYMNTGLLHRVNAALVSEFTLRVAE